MDAKIKYYENFATIKDAGEDGVICATASTSSIDRDGEIIVPRAFEKSLSQFVKHGAILACHQHRLPDGTPPMIGRPISADYVGDELKIRFMLGQGELAQKWRTAKDDGTWRGVSVGFIPQEGEHKDVNGKQVYHHTGAELLELSGVPVGSNRDAVLNSFAGDQFAEKFNELKKLFEGLGDDIEGRVQKQIESIKAFIERLAIPDLDRHILELEKASDVPDEDKHGSQDGLSDDEVLRIKQFLLNRRK